MSGYTGIHHAAFATRDIGMTVRFWRDLLGMRLVYAYGRPGYRQYFFEVAEENRISFFEWPEVEKLALRRHGEPVRGPFGFDHISIGVDDVERLWELMALLEGAGFPVSDVIDHGGFYSIYSYDPNGIGIEFSANVKKRMWRKPLLVDEEPPMEELEGSEPIAGRWPEPEPLKAEDRVVVPGDGSENFLKRR
ncbi:MAG: VOC family protein [Magnetococcales bacterium]|nr:VOC family protein [Magnetococcales bacterium]